MIVIVAMAALGGVLARHLSPSVRAIVIGAPVLSALMLVVGLLRAPGDRGWVMMGGISVLLTGLSLWSALMHVKARLQEFKREPVEEAILCFESDAVVALRRDQRLLSNYAGVCSIVGGVLMGLATYAVLKSSGAVCLSQTSPSFLGVGRLETAATTARSPPTRTRWGTERRTICRGAAAKLGRQLRRRRGVWIPSLRYEDYWPTR